MSSEKQTRYCLLSTIGICSFAKEIRLKENIIIWLYRDLQLCFKSCGFVVCFSKKCKQKGQKSRYLEGQCIAKSSICELSVWLAHLPWDLLLVCGIAGRYALSRHSGADIKIWDTMGHVVEEAILVWEARKIFPNEIICEKRFEWLVVVNVSSEETKCVKYLGRETERKPIWIECIEWKERRVGHMRNTQISRDSETS